MDKMKLIIFKARPGDCEGCRFLTAITQREAEAEPIIEEASCLLTGESLMLHPDLVGANPGNVILKAKVGPSCPLVNEEE
jgi:hypothetical protein